MTSCLRPTQNPGDIIGAVFAINGRIVAAEIYQSNQLFMSMWPDLVRAYSTEALALSNERADTSLNTSTVREFLHDAQQDEGRSKGKERPFNIRENATAISTEISDATGLWIHRGYISKHTQSADANTPDALATNILEIGSIDDRPIESLAYDESVLLRNDNSEHRWRAVIVRNTAENHFNMDEGMVIQLNTSRIQILSLRHAFSAEMPSIEHGSMSADVPDASRTKRNGVSKYGILAIVAAIGLFTALLDVLLGHIRRNVFLFIRERSRSIIWAVADSFLALVRFPSFVFPVYLQRSFSRSRLHFREFLFAPMLPAQNRVAAVGRLAFITAFCPAVAFISLSMSSEEPGPKDSANCCEAMRGNQRGHLSAPPSITKLAVPVSRDKPKAVHSIPG